MSSARLLVVVALISAGGLGPLSGRAAAQRGIETQTFRPALDGYGIFTVERAETGKQWDLGFRLFADYAHAPLVLAMKDAQGAAADRTVLDYQVTLHAGMHLSLADWLEVAAVLPMAAQGYGAAYGTSEDPLRPTGFYAADPRTNVTPPSAAPLDARVALKARLPRLGPLGVAVILGGTLPFGDDSAFLGDTGFTFRPQLVADITFLKGFTAALNVGYVMRERTYVLDPYDVVQNRGKPPGMQAATSTLIEVDDEISFGLGAAYRIGRWVGVGAELYGLVPLALERNPAGRTPASRDLVLDVLAGLNVFPGRSVQITIGGGAGVLKAHRHDTFRGFLGITWVPSEGGRYGGLGGGDADADGVPDNADQCPREPEDKDNFQDDDGCPDRDNDQDGVADGADRCPGEAEDKDGYEDTDGCPEPDNDLDGIADGADKCPAEPEDKDGFQDDDGCPELDNDGDGVPDTGDKCPGEPETQNGVMDDDGCPDTVGSAPAAARVSFADVRIAFAAGKSTLDPAGAAALDGVAAKLGASPQVRRVRIDGFADDKEKNARALAQARADAVREYLVKKGVEAARLQSAVGAGANKGRTVELTVVEQ